MSVWPQLFLNGLIAGSTYALLAIGFSLIYSTTRFFHFAHAAVYTWTPYVCLALVSGAKAPIPIAVVAALGTGTLLGALMEIGVYRPLRLRGATSLVLLVASLGMYVALQNCISLVFGDATLSLRGGRLSAVVAIGSARVTVTQMAVVAAAAGSVLVVALLLRHTRLGIALRAVASDPELASSTGVSVSRTQLAAFAIGSFLAAVAGILAAFDVDMTPTMGMNALLMAIVAAIAGGIGSLPGVAAGSLLVGLVQHLGVWRIGTQWQYALVFAVLLVFLTVRPQGVFGRKLRKAAV